MSSKIASATPVSKTHEQTNIVNDVHSQMNSTVVSECVSVDSRAALVDVVLRAKSHGRQVAIAGGRHAMGAQQFRTNQILIDTRNLDAVLSFDSESGLLEVESGLFWDDLIEQLNLLQQNSVRKWAIAQKQTGGDRLSIGGSLAVNMHGRGLDTPHLCATSSLSQS